MTDKEVIEICKRERFIKVRILPTDNMNETIDVDMTNPEKPIIKRTKS